jgi:hypothetical protein
LDKENNLKEGSGEALGDKSFLYLVFFGEGEENECVRKINCYV